MKSAFATTPIDSLAAHGFSAQLIARWKQSGAATLLPLQAKAVREYGFLQGRNLLVLAPTSAGKTFIAELAAMKHLEAGRRAVLLVPTRALAEEKGRQLAARYGPLGWRVAVATRERPETDRLVAEGRYDLLVAVYEKMRAYLVAAPERLGQIGLVAVDEIQTLGEPGRGEALDLLLAKIVRSPTRPQIVALSAVLSEGSRLASWLDCDLLIYDKRPVELREGVYNARSGAFRYHNFNDGEEAEEQLLAYPGEATDPEDAEAAELESTLDLAAELIQRRAEQTLIFVPMRAQSRRLASALAERLGPSPCPETQQALEALDRVESSSAREWLAECFRAGVAFHNADLGAELRALIEGLYRDGVLRAIAATPTLAQGVNLTGRNVIQLPWMAASDSWTGETVIAPLSVSRWRNQGGRAARYSLECEPGRSILIASGDEEAQRLYARYIGGRLEPLAAPLRGRPLDAAVADLAACGLAQDRDSAADLLLRSYTGIAEWRGAEGEFYQSLDEAAGRLRDEGLLRDTGGRWSASGLGAAMAAHGLRLETVIELAGWLRGLGTRPPDPFESALALAVTADMAEFPVWLQDRERRQTDYPGEARERLADAAESNDALRGWLWPHGGFTHNQVAALKKAFMLDAWIGPDDIAELEQRFGALSGTFARLAEHAHWLCRALGDMAEALGMSAAQREAIHTLADRLPLGLPEEGAGLKGLRADKLGRGSARVLLREGYDSIESLLEIDRAELERILPAAGADALWSEIETRRPKAKTRPRISPRAPRTLPIPPRTIEAQESIDEADAELRLDSRDKGRVWLGDNLIELPPLPFQLLMELALASPRNVSTDTLSQQLWPDAVVEEQNLSHHKRAITRAFEPFLGSARSRDLILRPTRHKVMRLNWPPEKVVVS